MKIYERNRDELNEYSVTVKLTAIDGKRYDTRIFNEEGVMLLCMFSNQLKAKEFRKWAVTILKAHRHGPLGQHDPEKQQLLHLLQRATATIQMQTAVIQDFNAYLRGNDKGRQRILQVLLLLAGNEFNGLTPKQIKRAFGPMHPCGGLKSTPSLLD